MPKNHHRTGQALIGHAVSAGCHGNLVKVRRRNDQAGAVAAIINVRRLPARPLNGKGFSGRSALTLNDKAPSGLPKQTQVQHAFIAVRNAPNQDSGTGGVVSHARLERYDVARPRCGLGGRGNPIDDAEKRYHAPRANSDGKQGS